MGRAGKDSGRVFPLDGPIVTLGRPGAGVEGAIEFDEPSVSRVHAVLQWREDQDCYELSNRSFTNPAKVDGQPAVSGTLVPDGARIQLGSLVVEVQDARESPPPAEEPFMGCLELLQGPGIPGTRFQLFRKRSVIGRWSGCEVHLPAPTLARHHAVVEWYERLPVLLPLSSRTILVNGQPIPRGTFLSPNDWIILGQDISLRWLPADWLDQEGGPGPAPPLQHADEPEVPHAPPEDLPPAPPRQEAAAFSARASFFGDLASRLESREPIRKAVEGAASARFPRLAPQLSADLLGGCTLTEALGRFPGYFTSYELGMVAAGEEAGILEDQLRELARSFGELARLRLRFFAWLVPVLMGVGLVLPALRLRPVLETRGPEAYAAGVAVCLFGTALLALLLFGLRQYGTRFGTFRRLEERFLERLPLLGPALRLQAGGRFLKALGPLLAAGLQVQRAALLAAGCTGSTTHAIALMEAARRIEQGTPVLDALAPTGFLPPEVLDEVGRGEETGDLPDRLARASGQLHGAAQRALGRALPAVIGALAALLGLFLLLSIRLAQLADLA